MRYTTRTALLTTVFLLVGAATAWAQGQGNPPPGVPAHGQTPRPTEGAATSGVALGTEGASGQFGLQAVDQSPTGAAVVLRCSDDRSAIEERIGPFLTSLLIRKDVLAFGEDGRLAVSACRPANGEDQPTGAGPTHR